MKKLLLVLMLTLSVGAISTVSFTACSGGTTTEHSHNEEGHSHGETGGSTDTGGGAGDAGATGG